MSRQIEGFGIKEGMLSAIYGMPIINKNLFNITS